MDTASLQFAEKLKILDALKTCSKSRQLERGKIIHAAAFEKGYLSDLYVVSKIVSMYAKCGSMLDARRVFDGMRHPNVVAWNSLLFGYADNGEGGVALELFTYMKRQGCIPTFLTFVAALKACIDLAGKEDAKPANNGMLKLESQEKGMTLHSQAVVYGFDQEFKLDNTLVVMYAKCGSMLDAYHVFDRMQHHDVLSWTALILGYAENGEAEKALYSFSEMQREGCAPDPMAFVAAVKACTALATTERSSEKLVKFKPLERGMTIHFQIGTCLDLYVGNTLIDMYSNFGSMIDAHRVFNRLGHRDVVSWNALMLGYAENGKGGVCLELFSAMKCTPNAQSFLAALKACSMLSALQFGKQLHADIIVRGFDKLEKVANSLVDLYGKCGSMVDAQEVFDTLPRKNLVACTALMAGYSMHGETKRVFHLFDMMPDMGFQPNSITFLCVLNACSHAGLVDKGREFLEMMSSKYGVDPGIAHYTCMVDMLGRANRLDEAMELVDKMPFKKNAVAWMTVLGACRKLRNVTVGRRAFDSLLHLQDTNDAGAYILMANIYGTMNP